MIDLSPSLTGNVWSGLSRRLSRNNGSTVAGSFPTSPASAARSVPWPLPVALRLPNRLTLKLRRLGEFVGREFGGPLVEIVGDAHRADRVRARRARPHFVELVHRRQHGPCALLDDIQVCRQSGGVVQVPAEHCGGSVARAFALLSSAETERPIITAAAPPTALRIKKLRRSTPGGISFEINPLVSASGSSCSLLVTFLIFVV